MNTTSLHIQIEPTIKQQAQKTADELLKVYRFDEPKHYLSCIFNGLRLSRKDHGIYPEYLHLSRNPLNLQYRE